MSCHIYIYDMYTCCVPYTVYMYMYIYIYIYNCLHFSICACHPCAGAMLIFSVSFQF